MYLFLLLQAKLEPKTSIVRSTAIINVWSWKDISNSSANSSITQRRMNWRRHRNWHHDKWKFGFKIAEPRNVTKRRKGWKSWSNNTSSIRFRLQCKNSCSHQVDSKMWIWWYRQCCKQLYCKGKAHIHCVQVRFLTFIFLKMYSSSLL